MINILWLLVCSSLILLMQPGFMCLESGLTRQKNSINVAVKNLADLGVSIAFFWLFGYALMFGISQNGWFGSTDFFPSLESASIATFFLFQTMFCSTVTTIVSGAVAERMKFSAYLLVASLVSCFIYPLFGHWTWNGVNTETMTGWLGKLGFVDFAGSTVVHSLGAWVSLGVLMIIGSRTHRFSSRGKPHKIHGSNLQLTVFGAMLLWIGWLGFNGGSTLGLTEQVPMILVNTILAGVAGMIVAGFIGWQQKDIPEVEVLVNGSLAGLVSVTAPCHVISPPLAIIIGGTGAAVMMFVSYWLERWYIDDAVDAIAVHGGGGIWGTLAVGLFGNLDLLNTGLTRYQQIFVQLLGITTAGIWTFGITYLILRLINDFFPLRVSPEAEQIGLNVSEHGATTEIHALFQVMDKQAHTQDLSLRVPVEPFTEVGQIAQHYNQVMDKLEENVTRTKAIVNTATDAIITFSQPNLEIITANPSTEDIFGYPMGDLQQMPLSQIIGWPPPHRIRDQTELLSRLLEKSSTEVIGCRQDGSIFPIEAIITQTKWEKQTFYTGTFRDITERKKIEQREQEKAEQLHEKNTLLSQTLDQLKQTQAQLVQTEKMSSLGQMVAGIAHEINNPVSFIHGNLAHLEEYVHNLLKIIELYQKTYPHSSQNLQYKTEELELEFLVEDCPKLLQSMKVGTERIREIVLNLRGFSRLDEASMKSVNIHEGIESTLMILQHRLKAAGKEQTIQVKKQYNELPHINCYAGKLNQVLLNLLSNGIDALREKEKKIQEDNYIPYLEIQTELAEEINAINLRIYDNGLGIPETVRKKIFDPFFTTKPVGKGTGLGLSISYFIIVKEHQGKLNCNSTPGEGTEFLITIPLEKTV